MIGQTISHYRIFEKLGEGGMGVVYKAHDTKLDRLVALKFLPQQISVSEEDRARFLQEAKAASAVMHPNVGVIYDIQEHEGQQFIVMEYVDGKTLRQLVPVQKTQTAIDYAIQIGEALLEAHSKDIVHRDVKTDNIMVNSKNQIKVMDFGLAKLKGSLKLTKTSSTVGTLAYMAPEQIQGGEVDARIDIFSFGVVLYEMLTGHLPFTGEREAAIMYSILNEEPQPLSHHRTDLPQHLSSIMCRALQKDSARRYQSMSELIDDLKSRESGISEGALFSTKKRASIAVLPFRNLSPDAEQEYFCDGLAEKIINVLSHVGDLRVVARTSAFAFKGKLEDIGEIGRKLNVGTALEGSVRKSGKEKTSAQVIKELMRKQIEL